jgi:hypothetical protein
MTMPWTTDPLGEIVLVKPERWLFQPGEWSEVEAAIGTALPRDYKDLIADGLACVFDEELFIASPFDPNPNVNLVQVAARCAYALAYLRQSDPLFSVAAYPEPGGLLAWGFDGGGGNYHWDTTDPDPNRWTVCVEGRPMHPAVQRHDKNLTSYIDALGRGEIEAAALAEWPRPNSVIERRIPRDASGPS